MPLAPWHAISIRGSRPLNQGSTRCVPRLPKFCRHLRRVGLITYGPGPGQQCNVKLDLKPTVNAASVIMRTLDDLTPAGRTPLTSAVAEAADVLDYRKSPGVIVVVTDGEETCGASPCDLGKKLHAAAEQLTVHIIGFRMKDFSWTGENSILDAMGRALTRPDAY